MDLFVHRSLSFWLFPLGWVYRRRITGSKRKSRVCVCVCVNRNAFQNNYSKICPLFGDFRNRFIVCVVQQFSRRRIPGQDYCFFPAVLSGYLLFHLIMNRCSPMKGSLPCAYLSRSRAQESEGVWQWESWPHRGWDPGGLRVWSGCGRMGAGGTQALFWNVPSAQPSGSSPSCLSFVKHLFPDPSLCHCCVHCLGLTVPTVYYSDWLVIVVRIHKIYSLTVVKGTVFQGIKCSHCCVAIATV